MVNNYDWFGSNADLFSMSEIFTVNYMMSKESRRNGLIPRLSYLFRLTKLLW